MERKWKLLYNILESALRSKGGLGGTYNIRRCIRGLGGTFKEDSSRGFKQVLAVPYMLMVLILMVSSCFLHPPGDWRFGQPAYLLFLGWVQGPAFTVASRLHTLLSGNPSVGIGREESCNP